jgi:NADP-dependent 3-hydroxy acid dehydrogenase YdfG
MSISHKDGTTAVVTGATKGFGRATVMTLASTGTHVIGVARDRRALKALADVLGTTFTPLVADVTEPDLAARLISEYRPRILVLNAGATPMAAPLSQQSWENFELNWQVDVKHVFQFIRQALVQPLDPGSTVISMSSGAALRGSPLSGGYAGAKSTIKFISAYAAMEAERRSLGIRFVSLLPQITNATDLGARFVAAYSDYNGTTEEQYLAQLGVPLAVDQVGKAILEIATAKSKSPPAYALTADGLSPVG